jgi:hypothetical protein
MPEFCQLAEKYHSNDASGDTEMKDAAQPARMPLMIVNNDNGTKTVLRSTRKAAKASAIVAPQVSPSSSSSTLPPHYHCLVETSLMPRG